MFFQKVLSRPTWGAGNWAGSPAGEPAREGRGRGMGMGPAAHSAVWDCMHGTCVLLQPEADAEAH